jgi:hypothetical protein
MIAELQSAGIGIWIGVVAVIVGIAVPIMVLLLAVGNTTKHDRYSSQHHKKITESDFHFFSLSTSFQTAL